RWAAMAPSSDMGATFPGRQRLNGAALRLRRSDCLAQRGADQLLETLRAGIGRAGVLAEPLGVGHAEQPALLRRPFAQRVCQIGNAVLADHPAELALVLQKHREFFLELRRDVDAELRCDPVALAIAAFDRIHEIEMRDAGERRRWSGLVVDDR